MEFVSAAQAASSQGQASRFTPLASCRDGLKCNIQGVVLQVFPAESTSGKDWKSAVMISDPSLGVDRERARSLKVVLFLPTRDAHPQLAGSRVGDIFRGFDCAVNSFRGRIIATMAPRHGSEFEIVNGEHSTTPLPGSGPNEEAELYFVREHRLRLMERDEIFAQRLGAGGSYRPAAFPESRLVRLIPNAPRVGVYPPQKVAPPPPHQTLPVPSAFERPAAPLPLKGPSPAKTPSEEKTLEMLINPIPGSKGYFCDLGAVMIRGISDPFGDCKKLNLVLWDGTGPRPDSAAPDQLAELIHATCWDDVKSREIMQMGENAWIELRNVRVGLNKHRKNDLEVHINKSSHVRQLSNMEPKIQWLLQMFAMKEQRSGQFGHGSAPIEALRCRCGHQMPLGATQCGMCARSAPPMDAATAAAMSSDKWKCQWCAMMTFNSRSNCYGCGKPRNSGGPLAGGDKWKCSSCGVLTFKSRKNCYGCHKPFNPQTDLDPSAALANATTTGAASAHLTSVPFGGGVGPIADKWKCSKCGTNTFKSKRTCFSCGKPYDAAVDGPATAAANAASPPRAANAPPPLETAPAPKRARKLEQLTEIVGLSESMMVLVEETEEWVPKTTRLANVISSTHDCARYVINCRVQRVHPQETRNCTVPACNACSNIVDVSDLSSVTACQTCGIPLSSDTIVFKYLVAFDVKEGPVSLTLLLVDDNAATFFHSLPACDLWSNHQTHKILEEKLDRLSHAPSVQFAIQSYTPAGKDKRLYQIFNTVLV